MNAQEQAWSGAFGEAYLERNRVDWRARIPFWTQMLNMTGARSVYEFGCNAGWNLSAIRRAFPDVAVYGTDVNLVAMNRAEIAGLKIFPDGGKFWPTFDLTFTAGVLIHISPEKLPAMMKRIVDASTQYVLAIEYEADEEQVVEYRGSKDLLWKRPFGKLYEAMGLEIVRAGSAPGFDSCTYWLLAKP